MLLDRAFSVCKECVKCVKRMENVAFTEEVSYGVMWVSRVAVK